MQVKRQGSSFANSGWTPRPPPPNRMGSLGRKGYARPWPSRQQPQMTGGDYDYSVPRQNFGRRRPFGRGGPAGRLGDFYGSYDDGKNAYPDYYQSYEDDSARPWNRRPPYYDQGTSSDDDADRHSKFSLRMTTASDNSGDCRL